MTATAVRSEQVRTLFSQSVPVLLSNLLVAAIVTATLWNGGPHSGLIAWLGLMTSMTVVRLLLWRGYRAARPEPPEAERWGTRFVVGSFVSGVLWGLAIGLFFDRRDHMTEVLLTLTVAGLSAGAAGTLACYPAAFRAFVVPALLPLALRNLAVADALHLVIGSMVVLFGAALTVVAHNTHRALRDAFRLRFENEALLRQLTSAQRALEQTNHTLEQRVIERTAAFERQSEALREARQLESVGRLAGGVAHDFNNLLTVILANITLLLKDQNLDQGLRQPLEEVESAASRGAELVRQLLAFGRRQRLQPRVLDLNDVLAGLNRILTRLIGDRVELTITPASGRALVKADRAQLEQVIINLVTNARDAMPEGGYLTIATSTIEAEGDAVIPSGSYVVVSVSDTGMGMDAETRRRVFEPFFTTKEQGKGTGLGLATVYGVVEQSGGHVLVQSEPGAGALFTVYLPRALDARVPEQTAAPHDPSPESMRATILLAEDNAGVRIAMERLLKQAGHEVISAASGEEALRRARAYGSAIQILVTDVVMATLSGPELARQLRAERPGVRVLFVSGYSQDETVGVDDPAQRTEYLQKPVTFEALSHKIRALLETGAAEETVQSTARSPVV